MLLWCSSFDLGGDVSVLLLSIVPSVPGCWNSVLPAVGPSSLQVASLGQSPFTMASSWPPLLPTFDLQETLMHPLPPTNPGGVGVCAGISNACASPCFANS